MINILGLDLEIALAQMREYGFHDVKVEITRAPRRGGGEFSMRVVKWDEKANTLYVAGFITELMLDKEQIVENE